MKLLSIALLMVAATLAFAGGNWSDKLNYRYSSATSLKVTDPEGFKVAVVMPDGNEKTGTVPELFTLPDQDAYVKVTVTAPDGATTTLQLTPGQGGRSTGTLPVSQMGLYRVSDGTRTALAAAGPLNPIEFADVRATPDKLAPLAAASGGGTYWLADGMPEIRRVASGRTTAGRNWLGLRENGDYVVAGFSETPLLPGIAALLLAVGALIAAWRREGR